MLIMIISNIMLIQLDNILKQFYGVIINILLFKYLFHG